MRATTSAPSTAILCVFIFRLEILLGFSGDLLAFVGFCVLLFYSAYFHVILLRFRVICWDFVELSCGFVRCCAFFGRFVAIPSYNCVRCAIHVLWGFL